MSSNRTRRDCAYVWVWLPGAVEPVVAGVVRGLRDGRLVFGYGESYLARPDALSIYTPELPLARGDIDPLPGMILAGCLRDGTPDAWGRRVIEDRLGTEDLTEIDYMLESGSNRFGALDFQESPTEYLAREDTSTLDELHEAAQRLQSGAPLSAAAEAALVRGTSIGGARPKVLVRDGDGVEWIAKLSSASDRVFSVVNAEATALELARRVGIEVPDFEVTESLGRDVLLVKRFDRHGEGRRRFVVSGLTMLGLDEMAGRYATYPELLHALERHGPATRPGPILFDRIAFNMAMSNFDDHARNHAAFWDGHESLTLTPAYDLAPSHRSGETAFQAMSFGPGGERESRFEALIGVSGVYGLDRLQARERVDHIVETIQQDWAEAADIGHLSTKDRSLLFGRQFLNPATVLLGDGPFGYSASSASKTPGPARGKTTPASNRGSFKARERPEGDLRL